MNSVGCFQHDSCFRTCLFGPLWFEDLRPSQAAGQGRGDPAPVRGQGRAAGWSNNVRKNFAISSIRITFLFAIRIAFITAIDQGVVFTG